MKKIHTLLIAFTTFVFVLGVFIFFTPQKSVKANDNTKNADETYFVNTDKEEITEIDAYNYAIVYIAVKGESGKTYTVNYRTEDGTLIAAANDYSTIEDGSVDITIPEDSNIGYSKTILLNVKKSGRELITAGANDYFLVGITAVNGNAHNEKLKVNFIGDNNYDVKDTSSSSTTEGKVIAAYEDGIKQYKLIDSREDIENSGESKIIRIPVDNLFSSKNNNLIYNKLANYFVGVEGKISWSNYFTDSSLMEYNLVNGNDSVVTTGAYVTNSSYSYEWLTPGENIQDGQSSGNSKWSKASSFSSVKQENWKDRTYIKETYEDEYYSTALSNANITTYKMDNSTALNPYVKIVNYSDAATYSIANKVESSIGSSITLNLKDWMSYTYIADTASPEVLDIYVLNGMEKITKTDTIKIAVRFSEPVQVLDKNLEVTLKTNSSTVKVEDKLPKFKLSDSQDYGEGTQTLIFEANASDIKDSIYLTKITGLKFSSTKAIRDFSSDIYNKINTGFYKGGYIESDTVTLTSDTQATSLKQIDFTIDSRTPKVDSIKTTGWKSVSKSKDFYINLSNVGTDFTFKYKLISKKEFDTDPDNYDLETDAISLYDRTSIIFSDDGKSGDYYFYYKLTSYFGLEISNIDELKNQIGNTESNQTYLLKYDNTIPLVYTDDENTYNFKATHPETSGAIDKSRYEFTFKLKDLPYTDETNSLNNISNIDFAYSYEDFNLGSYVYLINVYDGKNKYLGFKTNSDGSYTFSVSLADIKASDSSLSSDLEYLDLYAGLYITDTAGNIYDIDSSSDFVQMKLRFDTRNSLEDNYVITNEESQKLKGLDVYKTNTQVVYSLGNATDVVIDSSYSVNLYKYSYDRYNEKSLFDITTVSMTLINTNPSLDDDYYSVTYDNTNRTYTVVFKTPGYYEIQFNVDNNEFSNTYEIYIATDTTEGQPNDPTYNTQNSNLIINEVYSLGDNKFYYYNGSAILTENYNESANPQFFSSKVYLESYIKYYEYQDLSTLTLTASTARQLNSGSNANYKKASGEDTTAKEGQVWIRYKKADWNYSTLTSEWVYYFYKDSLSTNQINTQDLRANLKAAINSVVTTIESYTSKINLVTEDYLVDGIPNVSYDQIHDTTEIANTTKTGITLRNANFEGDSEIYQSRVYDESRDIYFYFYSNYILDFGAFTKIYYKDYDSQTASYTEITLSSSNRRMNEILKSGKYELVEIDEYGMSSTPIWIISEEDAPELGVELENSSDSNIITDTYNYEMEGSKINVKSFTMNSLTSEDDYAYVVVYFTNNKRNYKTYYAQDIAEGISLSDGNYTIYVSDRFGNAYTFQVSVNSADISYQLTNVNNDYILFRCDIESTDIFSFSVKLNGSLIDTQYAKRKTYKESGVYEIYIEDVYGNTNTSTIELQRKPPVISWYYNDEGVYRLISNTSDVILSEISETYYEIATRTQLQFRFSEDYGYEISSGIETRTTTASGGTTVVTVEAGKSFKLRVYYNDYEDGYVDYMISYDDEAPKISVEVPTKEYTYDDYAKIKAGESNIESIRYSSSDDTTYILENNSKIFSDNIKISISDATRITKLTITIAGKVVYDGTLNTSSSSLDLISLLKQKQIDIYGAIKIVCTDILGNESIFEFKNEEPNYYKYAVDSINQTIKTNPDTALTETLYGYDNILFGLSSVQDIVMLVDNIYLRFIISDNTLYSFAYNGVEYVQTNLLPTAQYKEYVAGINGIKVYYRYKDSMYYIMVQTVDDSIHTITSRTLSDYSIFPLYNSFELNGLKSEVEFDVDGAKMNFDNYVSNNNSTFTLNTLYDQNIVSIIYAYSNVNSNFKYETFDPESNLFGELDGFYRFIVTNKYGNKTEYLIIISRRLLIETEVTYKDGLSIDYTNVDNSIFYTNNKASIIIYTKNYDLKVLKDKVSYSVNIIKNNSEFDMFELTEIGDYNIEIIDISGNIKVLAVSIKNAEFSVSDEILTGFNEQALKLSELYTNQMITIDKNKLSQEGVFYITLTYNNKENVIYDNISQAKITNVDLDNIIGYNNKDGEYIIKFRNEYGEICEKTVYYRSTPTIHISRMTRSDTEYTLLSLESITDGIYSNNKVKFETDAKVYQFMVDNNNDNCPREITFASATSAGTYTYVVTYLDEYGFSYTFNVYLIRQQISYELSDELKDVNGVDTITKNFNILFDSSVDATYELNSKVYSYTSEEKLTKDGLYKFSLTDRAGNNIKFTIKKDTIVSFNAFEDGSNRPLANGDVSNEGNITISSKDSDKITITKAYLNGVLQENITSRFDSNGKWELLIEDAALNETYFCFYIYKAAISKFVYDTPYNYKITKIVYKDKSGNIISYIDEITQNEYNSHVELTEDGNYSIEMLSFATNETVAFEININNVAPNVSLVGVENGGHTNKNIKITGYQEGDIIKIYKDGSVYKTINVTSSNMDSPVLDEMGSYVIEVTNTIGNTTTLEFSRSYTANTASSVFIVVVLVVVATGLFIGLYSRKREKID